jgi:hypothetical protein
MQEEAFRQEEEKRIEASRVANCILAGIDPYAPEDTEDRTYESDVPGRRGKTPPVGPGGSNRRMGSMLQTKPSMRNHPPSRPASQPVGNKPLPPHTKKASVIIGSRPVSKASLL